MIRSKLVCVWLVAITTGTGVHAQSTSDSATSKLFVSDDITVSSGVRLWGNRWDIPVFDTVPLADPQAPGGFVLQDTATTSLSKFKVAFIPFIGVRIGNVIASANYFIRTHYDPQNSLLSNVSRDELDLALGYSIFPASSDASLVVSIAYKRAKIKEHQSTTIGEQFDTTTTINAGLVGLNGSAPLSENWRLYGSAAYGLANQKFSPIVGQEVNQNLDGRYKFADVGVNYSFYRGGESQTIRAASILLGYRTQIYTIKSFTLMTRSSSGAVIATDTRDVDSTTSGPVLSVVATF